MKNINIFIVYLALTFYFSNVLFSGETPSVPGTKVYFIDLKDGDKVKSPFIVRIGLTEQMGIAPAMAD